MARPSSILSRLTRPPPSPTSPGRPDSGGIAAPNYRIVDRNPGVLKFEPDVGGRLIEAFDNQVFTTGPITAWDSPQSLKFEWRGVNFVPGESTSVKVFFQSVPTGTRVTIHHTGWAGLRTGHPVRHGQPVPAHGPPAGRLAHVLP